MTSSQQYLKQSPPSNNRLPSNDRPLLVRKKKLSAPAFIRGNTVSQKPNPRRITVVKKIVLRQTHCP